MKYVIFLCVMMICSCNTSDSCWTLYKNGEVHKMNCGGANETALFSNGEKILVFDDDPAIITLFISGGDGNLVDIGMTSVFEKMLSDTEGTIIGRDVQSNELILEYSGYEVVRK